MLNHPCIPGMKKTWSWCIIFLIFWWIWFVIILLRISASMFIKVVDLQFSFSDVSLFDFEMSVILIS
jgi:hypothetical protein